MWQKHVIKKRIVYNTFYVNQFKETIQSIDFINIIESDLLTDLKVEFSYTLPNKIRHISVDGFRIENIPNTKNSRLILPNGNLTTDKGEDIFWYF